jgi:ubiquinone/menaquinone biosynthesis C-methylase UbiE
MNIGEPPATVLDVGCSDSDFPLSLAAHNFKVYGLDIREYHIKNPSFLFIQGSILNTSFPDQYFDVLTAISSVEHLGLSGRYSVEEDIPSAEKKAMKEMRRILKDNGRIVLTVPYGRFAVLKPWHKVYDAQKLADLTAGFTVLKEKFFVRNRDIHDPNGCWVSATKETASEIAPFVISKGGAALAHQYSLACLVLKPKLRDSILARDFSE